MFSLIRRRRMELRRRTKIKNERDQISINQKKLEK